MSVISEKLKAKKEAQAEPWHPNVDDILEGIVTEIGETQTDNGLAKYAHVETDTGKVTVFINSVLQKQFEQEKVEEGVSIGIQYLGKVKSKKSDNEYKNYLVVRADETE